MTKGSSLLKGKKLTRHGNKKQISNLIKGYYKKTHSKLTVYDEIPKAPPLQLKTRQKCWSLDIVPEALASMRSENEGKGEKELSLLDNTLICVENPEHTYKLEEQVTDSWAAKW